ncbi:GntR family transcriptional regulator [bacterium]|nr:GntR family transcriptional regulator [bacterium]
MAGKQSKSPLTETAYEKIYNKIVTLEYAPGQQLEEKQLMKELKIGRTPIRETLLKLAGEMMLESHHNKGFIVRPILLQNTKAVFEALRILEHGVADLAIRHNVSSYLDVMEESNEELKASIPSQNTMKLVETNNRFHINFSLCSHNEYLVRSLKMVRCEARRLAYLSFSNEISPGNSLQNHYLEVANQHDTIVKAIRDRDAALIKGTLDKHIQDFQQRIVAYMTFQ